MGLYIHPHPGEFFGGGGGGFSLENSPGGIHQGEGIHWGNSPSIIYWKHIFQFSELPTHLMSG